MRGDGHAFEARQWWEIRSRPCPGETQAGGVVAGVGAGSGGRHGGRGRGGAVGPETRAAEG
jgi:hypothetical protein